MFIVTAETWTPNCVSQLSNTQLLALCMHYIISEAFIVVPFPYVSEQQDIDFGLSTSPELHIEEKLAKSH